MRFNGRRDPFTFYVWLCMLIPYGGICALIYQPEKDLFPIYIFGLFWLLMGIFFYLIVKSTFYTFIDNETLVCQTMYYFKKTIPISAIRRFEKSNGFYAGLKMSTAYKCLIMHYNTYDELLISPENEELFIAEVERRKALINP